MTFPGVVLLPAVQWGQSRLGTRPRKSAARGWLKRNGMSQLFAEVLCWIRDPRVPNSDGRQHPQSYRVLRLRFWPASPRTSLPLPHCLPIAHASPQAHTQAQHRGKRGEVGKYLAESNLQKSLIGPSYQEAEGTEKKMLAMVRKAKFVISPTPLWPRRFLSWETLFSAQPSYQEKALPLSFPLLTHWRTKYPSHLALGISPKQRSKELGCGGLSLPSMKLRGATRGGSACSTPPVPN